MLSMWLRSIAVQAFGESGARVKQPYLSAGTLGKVQFKAHLARLCRRAGQRIHTAGLYICVRHWRSAVGGQGGPPRGWNLVFGFASRFHVERRVILMRMLAWAKADVEGQVTMEHGLHIDRVNRDMESALAVGDQVAMFAALRKLRPWRVRPLYRVQQQSGAPSVSYLDERRAFQEHFAGVLDGCGCPLVSLCKRTGWTTHRPRQSMPLVVPPSLWCLRSLRSHGSRPRLPCARLSARTGSGVSASAQPRCSSFARGTRWL